jgi:hypothetical protein
MKDRAFAIRNPGRHEEIGETFPGLRTDKAALHPGYM